MANPAYRHTVKEEDFEDATDFLQVLREEGYKVEADLLEEALENVTGENKTTQVFRDMIQEAAYDMRDCVAFKIEQFEEEEEDDD